MGLHLHRKLTAIIIALFMLMPLQASAVFGVDEETPEVQETQQTEQAAEPEPEKETKEEAPAESSSPEDADASENVDSGSAEKSEASAPAESEKKDSDKEQSVEVSFKLLGEDADDEWIKETDLSVPKDSTVKDTVETVLKESDSKCSFNDEGSIESISFKSDSGVITLNAGAQEDTDGEPSKWICRINGEDRETGLDECKLSNKDKVLVYYKDPSKPLPDEAAAETEAEAEEVPAPVEEEETLTAFVKTTAGPAVDNAYGNTQEKLTNVAEKGGWTDDTTWIVLALARGGSLTDAQANGYYNSIKSIVQNAGSPKVGNLASDNAKAILALTAAGFDPSNVAGYNLLEPLSNMGSVRAQGINGPIWALLAFDSKNYIIPALDTGNESGNALLQTTRPRLISAILSGRKSDGGWAYSGSTSDVDMTAMAIQALAPYYDTNPDVKSAVDGALNWLSSVQNSDGSFSTYGNATSESASQVIVALTSLGIDPTQDARFMKNGKGAVDSLMSFYVKGGGFKHLSSNSKSDNLASMQGYYALVAYYRSINSKNSLYNMTDAGDGFLIEVDYEKEKADENGGGNSDESKGGSEKSGSINDIESGITALGATKGLTKSAGLIKLKGMTENAKKSMGMIEAVLKRGLSEDASTYSEEDIAAINNAYKAYLDLQPAEKLAVEKDKNWKKFCKLTDALGKIYHIDRDDGVDVLDNNGIIMPWHVRLVVREQELPGDQSKKISDILGEESQIFGTYDISFTNTLDTDESGKEAEWHPSNILKVNMGVPDALDNNPIIIHVKDEGKIEFLDNEVVSDEENRYASYEKYAQFQSDDFSVYGIASTSGTIKQMISQTNNKEEEEAPSDYLIWVYIGVAALAALALVMILRRRSAASEEVDE